MSNHRIHARLDQLRAELRAERISYGELAELQDLADFIDPSDTELLEAAGVPEIPTEPGMNEKQHRIRSTTDEMLAARHDPEPWVDRNGDRYAHPRLTGASLSFEPRVECIPSRDPYPYVEVAPGVGNTGRRYTSREQATSINMTFRPRPEFARPEPNPILVAFREETDRTAEQAAYWSEALSRFQCDEPWSVGDYMDVLEDVLDAGCTPSQIEGARKVLTRLVAVFG